MAKQHRRNVWKEIDSFRAASYQKSYDDINEGQKALSMLCMMNQKSSKEKRSNCKKLPERSTEKEQVKLPLLLQKAKKDYCKRVDEANTILVTGRTRNKKVNNFLKKHSINFKTTDIDDILTIKREELPFSVNIEWN